MDLLIVNQPRVNPYKPNYQIVKRILEMCLCIALLPFAIPVMLVCMLAIFLDSGRPVFYVQKRIGRGGRPFNIYKFRTLQIQHEENRNRTFMKAYVRGEIGDQQVSNGTFKPVTATQILRVGHFLRRTSLDELPQLINVLKGEMSIVGPRPNVPWEVDAYQPWHYERLEVLPGITGLAQVNGRSGISFNAIVRYDINYIENQGLALDLMILWLTMKSVILRKGVG